MTHPDSICQRPECWLPYAMHHQVTHQCPRFAAGAFVEWGMETFKLATQGGDKAYRNSAVETTTSSANVIDHLNAELAAAKDATANAWKANGELAAQIKRLQEECEKLREGIRIFEAQLPT